MAGEAVTSILGELESLISDPKATEDFSSAVKILIPQVDTLVQAARINEAIEEMLVLEKKCRQACDATSCSLLCCKILNILKVAENWEGVIEYVQLLCKKRGQLKRSITDMVQLAMSWLNGIQSIDTKIQLLNTLSAITEGKIFVEVERARLTLYLAQHRESEGKIDEAATLLQDVQVETFGAMNRREKVEFILEQMRLVLLKKDFVRCQIISRKINPKLLEATDFQDVKLKYYEYLVRYHLNEDQLLNVCKDYYAMFKSECIQEDRSKWVSVLQSYVLYLLLAPYDNEQKDMVEKVKALEKKKLSEIPIYEKLVNDFLTFELIPFNLPNEAEIRANPVFQDTPHSGGDQRWKLLKKRVVQHNIRVIGMYYSQITMKRAAAHLNLSEEGVEEEISELVSTGFFEAKLDRPAGILRFGKPLETYDYLNKWASDIGRSIELIEESSHLIQKEKMIHSARSKKLQMINKNL